MHLLNWLNGDKQRRQLLSKSLSVTVSAISLAARGRMRVPPSWYSTIVEISNGEVGYTDLVPPRNKDKGKH